MGLISDFDSYDYSKGGVLQSDGKIIFTGLSWIGDQSYSVLVRYNNDGTLDTAFGNNGRVLTQYSTFNQTDGISIQSDGKILTAGVNGVVMRYNNDGSLDTTFDNDGMATGNFTYVSGITIQNDGKILVGGTAGNDFTVLRYNAEGSLDSSFGGGSGQVTTDFGSHDSGTSMILQSDNKILLAGVSNENFALVRYNSDGSVDTSFGDGTGKVTKDFGSTDYARTVAIQPDGKIVVSGATSDGNQFNLSLIRYNTDGSLDATFGSDDTTPPADINHAPVPSNATIFGINEGSTTDQYHMEIYNYIISQAFDADGDTLSIISVDTTNTLGIVTLNTDTSSLNYSANVEAFEHLAQGELYVDTFQYTISDGHGGIASETAHADVWGVNDTPTSTNTTISINEATLLNALLPNASDLDADTIVYTLKSNPYHGTAVVQTNGSFSYTPDPDFSGIDLFTYTVSDNNGGENSYSVKVDVIETTHIQQPSVSGVTLSDVAKLYVATFNRAPDVGGLDYWVYGSGLGIEQIAQSFFDQSETKALYAEGTTTEFFVTSVYQNLFNRAPDKPGLDYWVHELETGSVAKQNFILAVMNGALDTDVSLDRTILDNKMNIGLFFAQEGLNNVDYAKSVMESVNAYSDSVEASMEMIIEEFTFLGLSEYVGGML